MPDLLRLEVDLEEVKEMRNVKVEFPNPTDITVFIVSIVVREGLYSHKWFRFKFTIPQDWPYDPPDVKILDKIWHPNIELVDENNPNTGRVCVSTLKNSYRATLLMWHIVESLKYLLINPNANDALNVEAADQQLKNYDAFKIKATDMLEKLESDEEDDQ